MKKLCFIGGDMRQIRVVNNLSEIFPVIKVYGFSADKKQFSENVEIYEDIKDAIIDSDVVICPLPYSTDGETINAPFFDKPIYIEDLLKVIKKNELLLVGKKDSKLEKLTEFYKVRCIDYLEREELAVLNAVPTAEGAIETAMRETPFTLNGSKVLILGNGRIGKVLAKMLCGIGADVTACVRKYKDAAYCRAMGYGRIFFSELSEKICEYNVIFNTVPTMVIDESEIKKIKSDAVIIDLASKPGGVNFKITEKYKVKTIWALSLPGKAAPDTAGDFIAETIINIIRELEV